LLSSAAAVGYAIERDRGLPPGTRDAGAARFPVAVGVGDRIRSTTYTGRGTQSEDPLGFDECEILAPVHLFWPRR
jgi:hypothetical protein